MLRRSLVLLLLHLVVYTSYSQLQSPEQFLGYAVGTKFTPHSRVVEYFRHVAAAVPGMVKLEQYGKTNEGRPLLAAFVSNSSAISNLENIRLNNLALAGSSETNVPAVSTGAPAIVWLSYNVHGYEASSTEVSMLTLYALVDPKNTQT